MHSWNHGRDGETRPQLWRIGERGVPLSKGETSSTISERDENCWTYRKIRTPEHTCVARHEGDRPRFVTPIHVSHEAISRRGRSNSDPFYGGITRQRRSLLQRLHSSNLPSCGTRFREARDGSGRRSMLISISPSLSPIYREEKRDIASPVMWAVMSVAVQCRSRSLRGVEGRARW